MRRFVIATIVILLLSTATVSALTNSEFQAYINQLNAAARKITAQRSPTNSIRTLSRGMSGTDVANLQKFLAAQNLLSKDSVTGYFGALTEEGVKLFQSRTGIVTSGTAVTNGFGAVGPKTRKAIAQATTFPASVQASSPQGTPPASSQSVDPQIRPYVPTNSFTTSVTNWNPIVPNDTPVSSSNPAPLQPTQAGACTFNGQTIAHGQSTTAYELSSEAIGSVCASQSRTCLNGTLSGTYQYAGCSVGGAASCSLNGITVAHNASNTFYSAKSVPFGSVCSSVGQVRTCANGTLTGDAQNQNASCTVAPASSCTFNNQSIPNGQTVTGYGASSVTFGSQCTSQTRTCSNGTLSGTYNNPSCIVGAAQSCIFSNNSLSSGASVTAYQSSTVQLGASCLSETRTCINGLLSGSNIYNTCSVNASASCTFSGQSVAHGGSVTAFQSSSVSFGSTCVGQTRSCSNGSLSGSYINATCTVGKPASCSFNGQTIQSGQSVTAYSQNSVSSGSSCTAVAETRMCTNGALGGTYTNAACAVISPPNVSITVNGQTGNVTLLSGSAFTLAWSSANVSSCTSSTYAIDGNTTVWGISPNTSVTYQGTFSGNSLSYNVSCTGINGSPVNASVNITPTITPADPFTNKYFSAAMAYIDGNSPINLILGTFHLKSDHTIDASVYYEDARNALTPLYSSVSANLMSVDGALISCTPQNIPIPHIFNQLLIVHGTWSSSGDTLTVSADQMPTFTFTADASGGNNAYINTNVSGYNTSRGYAYISDTDPFVFPGPLADEGIYSYYNGTFQQNRFALDNLSFNTFPAEMNWKGLVAQSNPNVRSQTNTPSDGVSQYGFQNLARNMPGFYPNMLFSSFGHDFNNDYCANDGGHSIVYYGIPKNGKVLNFLIVESSITGNNTPAYIGVGRLLGS